MMNNKKLNSDNFSSTNVQVDSSEISEADEGLSPTTCSLPNRDPDVLISQVLRECEKADLADFSFLSDLDSESALKDLLEKFAASRLNYLKNQKVLQAALDATMSSVEILQEICRDHSSFKDFFRANVKGQTRGLPRCLLRLVLSILGLAALGYISSFANHPIPAFLLLVCLVLEVWLLQDMWKHRKLFK